MCRRDGIGRRNYSCGPHSTVVRWIFGPLVASLRNCTHAPRFSPVETNVINCTRSLRRLGHHNRYIGKRAYDYCEHWISDRGKATWMTWKVILATLWSRLWAAIPFSRVRISNRSRLWNFYSLSWHWIQHTVLTLIRHSDTTTLPTI